MNPSKIAKENTATNGAETIIWDLSDLYPSPDDPSVQTDIQQLRTDIESFEVACKGNIADLNAARFAVMLQQYESILSAIGKLGSYAHLLWTTDTERPEYGQFLQTVKEILSELHQKLVFFDVEWLALEDQTAQEWIEAVELEPWRHYLVTSRQYKKHILSEEAEQVLSAKSVTSASAWNRYFDETLGAARFECNGEKLTEQQALSRLHDPDRIVREEAHRSLTDTFRHHSRTLTFVFNTILSDKQITDRLRGYPTWISSRNLSNQIDDTSVQSLVNAVTSRYDLVQRYYRFKKKLLHLETMKDYDRYAPVQESTQVIHWHDAKRMVLDAFGEFHPTMRDIASMFFEKKWIDAAIRPGKRGGAYSASTVTTVHPYVFMNYDGRIRDVQTLAHELGHGIHQYLAAEQGELQSSTPLTTAETASVFGEMLVFRRLYDQQQDPQEKLAMLIGKIDDTIATVFRQISMNRFEDRIHTLRREQGELTTEQFDEAWAATQSDLYGDSVELTDGYRRWWSYIPHFLHTPGYVYAYAFGELLVLALFDLYQSGRAGFEENYLNLLRAGGSDWPHTLIGKMGVDIQDQSFWNKGLTLFEGMIKEAENLHHQL